MCRLFGIIANKPVDVEFSLERFKKFAKQNPDGWGIGWYEDKKAMIFKQGIPAIASSEFLTLSKGVRSNIIIAHVRKGTRGEPSERNSHPFKHENWIFAHNGSIDRDYLFQNLKQKYREEIKGETDSEVYFYWILQCIGEEGNVIDGIKKAVMEVKKRNHTGLNFLLSDGSSLFAFRYSPNSLKAIYSLYKLERKMKTSDYKSEEFLSEETGALIRSKLLRGEKAVLICSEKLTEENWTEIELGTLVIIESDLRVKEMRIL